LHDVGTLNETSAFRASEGGTSHRTASN